jgi:pyruvate formate lyase activating enzyme
MMVKLIEERCRNCNFCNLVLCPQKNVKTAIESGSCMGCQACLSACPEEALTHDTALDYPFEEYQVVVNGKTLKARGLIKDAIQMAGIPIEKTINWDDKETHPLVFMPCQSGACWACSVQVNGQYALSCITPLGPDMEIRTLENPPPLRVVSGFGAHTVGGVGTPYQLKQKEGPIEVLAFTHGCNLRCPQSQNYQMAYTAGGHLLDGHETAQILLGLKDQYRVNRIALSGGECTLNPSWLLEVIKTIRMMSADVKIHVDTNGTLLNPDYIEKLIHAGMTEIGVDLKALHTSTFLRITGMDDAALAKRYLQNSWNAVDYIVKNELNVFLGVGIPYHPELISKDEVAKMGNYLADLDPQIQVSVLDYRGEFRRKDLIKPSFEDMMGVKSILNSSGLEKVIAQTSEGHIGP